MTNKILYETFNDEWKKESTNSLIQTFESFSPLSSLMREDATESNLSYDFKDFKIQNSNISFDSMLGKMTSPNMKSFEEIFKGNSKFQEIKDKLRAVEEHVSKRVKLVRTVWLTFGSNVTGAQECSCHVHHPLLQDRANVWAVAVPLYFDKNSIEKQHFYYTILKENAPFECVGDYKKVYEQNYNYISVELPRTGEILGVQFDSMRVPHYVNYSNDVYMWITFDGVVYKHSANHEPTEVILSVI